MNVQFTSVIEYNFLIFWLWRNGSIFRNGFFSNIYWFSPRSWSVDEQAASWKSVVEWFDLIEWFWDAPRPYSFKIYSYIKFLRWSQFWLEYSKITVIILPLFFMQTVFRLNALAIIIHSSRLYRHRLHILFLFNTISVCLVLPNIDLCPIIRALPLQLGIS